VRELYSAAYFDLEYTSVTKQKRKNDPVSKASQTLDVIGQGVNEAYTKKPLGYSYTRALVLLACAFRSTIVIQISSH
jgi:hypothetical protein